MERNLFDRICDELGYDRDDVLVVRLTRQEATVSWTEPSGMPRGTAHRLDPGPPGVLAAA